MEANEEFNKYYEKGIELLKEKKYTESDEMFKKCAEINPRSVRAYYQLLLNAIAVNNYKSYVDICKKLKEFKDPRILSNANYFLYMLQFIGGESYVFNISLDDILLSSAEYERNDIREKVFNKDFITAGNLLHDRYLKETDDELETLVESKLILTARNHYGQQKENYFDLVATRNYGKLLHLLDERIALNTATNQEKYLRKLCSAFLNLSHEATLKFNDHITGNVFQLIDGGNYRAALSESIRFNKRNDKTKEDNLITLVLDDICYLKKRLDRAKKVNEQLKSENKYDEETANFYRNLLVQRGARVLGKNISESDIEQLKKYNNVQLFPIEDEKGNKRTAIIYKDDRYVSDLAKANKLFSQGEYYLAIKEYTKVIETTYDYPDYVYARLAQACEITKDVKKALIYYRLAFNKEHDIKLKHEYIRKAISLKNRKDKRNQSTKEREVENESNTTTYSVPDFESINKYIIDNGLDVTTACEQLGLTDNNANKVKLIYAREYYKCHEEAIGDLFVKSVEQALIKSEDVKNILKKIKEMKKVYLNRSISNEYNLPLTIRPTNTKRYKH